MAQPTENIGQEQARRLLANGLPCLIGSLPLIDHQEAIAWILEHVPAIPLWPQLPVHIQEGMLRQFVEGCPGLTEDSQRVYFDLKSGSFDQELLAFYEDYLKVQEDPEQLADSRFAISRQRAAGIYALREAVSGRADIAAIKGQITGPFTFLTGITDQDHRLGYYDPALRDMAVKGLAMKAAWQVGFYKDLGLPVMIFIDEPGIAGLGSSAFISLSREDVAQDLNEVISAIHAAGGMAGIHVCGNTDWGFLLSLPIDVLSFDAYGFFDRIVIFKEQIRQFLEQGGILAWGIVPTSDRDNIAKEDAASLVEKWEEQAQSLTDGAWDLPALLRQALITPSCGTGSLSGEMAQRVLGLTRDVSNTLRRKYLPF